MSPDSVLHMLQQVLKRAGLERIRFHDRRHTCASALIQNRMPLIEVQQWLGHTMFAIVFDNSIYRNSTLGGQRATCLPAAKINAGCVIVLSGRQPTVILFLASPDFFSLAGPTEFFGNRFGGWQGRRDSWAAAQQRG